MVRKLLVLLTSVLVIGLGAMAFWQASQSGPAASAASAVVAGPRLAKAVCEPFYKDGDTSTTSNRTVLKIGSPVPGVVLKTLEGQPTNLEVYNTKTYRLLEFFAPWCPHCQHSIPALKQVQQQFDKVVTIVAVNGGNLNPNLPASGQAFKAKYHITYPILEGVSMPMVQSYCVMGFPTFYLVDKAGYVRWAFNGTLEGKDLKALTTILSKAAK